MSLRPSDFHEPVVRALSNDIFLAIDKHGLDAGSVLAALCHVTSHCIGCAKSETQVNKAIDTTHRVVRREARDIFRTKSSALKMEAE